MMSPLLNVVWQGHNVHVLFVCPCVRPCVAKYCEHDILKYIRRIVAKLATTMHYGTKMYALNLRSRSKFKVTVE